MRPGPTVLPPLSDLFLYLPSDALVVDVQTYEAIFVGYVYTLTDGPSCQNVLPLSCDVLETPCQLLIQAD